MKRIYALIFLGALCLGLLIYSFLDRPVAAPEKGTEPVETVTTGTVTEPSQEPTEPATEPQPVALLRIGCSDEGRQAEWEQMAKGFSAVSGVEVELVSASDPEAVLVIHPDATSAIDQCAQWRDLYDTAAYAQLASWDMALRHDGKVCAIPTQSRCIGLMCNTQLLAASGYSLSEIDSFQKLQLVVNQLADAGGKAFAAPDPALLTLVAASAPDQSRQFVDLYMANALPQGEEGDQAGLLQMQRGEAVFWLGQTDAYDQLGQTPGILPVYFGLENEQSQTLCTVGEGFVSVRKDAPEAEVQAAMALLDYLVLPSETEAVPLDQLTTLAPFRQTTYTANVLEQRLLDDLAAGKSCIVCTTPDQLPEGAEAALLGYISDPTDDGWESFAALLR